MELQTKLLLEEIKKQYRNLHYFSIHSSAGISYQTLVSMFRRGIASANFTLVKKICLALGIDINEFIDGKIIKIEDTDSYKMRKLFEKIEKLQQRELALLDNYIDLLLEAKEIDTHE